MQYFNHRINGQYVIGYIIFGLSVLTPFLQSVYIGGFPVALYFPLVAACAFWIMGQHMVMIEISVVTLIIVAPIFFSSALNADINWFEATKAGIGVYEFMLTIRYFRQISTNGENTLKNALCIVFIILLTGFYVDFFGVINFKEVGFVGVWTRDGIEAIKIDADPRPSGLYSEASWYAISSASIALFFSRKKLNGKVLIYAAWLFSMVIAQSTIGYLLIAIVIFSIYHEVVKKLNIYYISIGLAVILLGLIFGGEFMSGRENVISKLIDPFSSDSGQIRLLSPMPVAASVLDYSPYFGFGLGSVSSKMAGVVGTSIMPLNIFIEGGFLGLIIYSYCIIEFALKKGADVWGVIFACVVCVSLGLQGSPFQAAILCIALCGKIDEYGDKVD